MTITKKLMYSFSTLSMLLIFGLINEINDLVTSKVEMQTLSQVLDSGSIVASAVHEMQVERGLTAGYLASKGEKNRESLLSQRSKVDQSLLAVNSIPVSSLPKEQAQALGALLMAESELMRKRDMVTALSISAGEAIGFYTASIKHGIDFMNSTVSVADVARASQALRMLITAKEYAGQERAVGNAAFTASKFADAEAMHRFVSLGAQRRVLLDEFLKLAPPAQSERLNTIRNSDLFTKLTLMETSAIAKALAGEPLNTSAVDWFAASTQRINEFKVIEDELGVVLGNMAQHNIGNATNSLILLLLLSLLLLALLGWLYVFVIDKGIRQPLILMVDGIRLITNRVQFHDRISYDAQDEVGDTARALNALLTKLEQAMQESNRVISAIAQGDFSQRIQNTMLVI